MFSESLTIVQETDMIGSKSVTKVQNLPSVGIWNETNVILKDYIKSYFSKKAKILRLNQNFPSRKRVTILTNENNLLVYETNCTGYVFAINSAKKLGTISKNSKQKECIISLKFKFGSVNLVLINHQISIWRRTLYNIFENQTLDQSLLTDISLYTAKDENEEEQDNISEFTYESTNTNFEYTDTNISLKSVQACANVNIPNYDLDVTQDAYNLSRTNSNRSLTYLPTVRTISQTTSINSKRSKSIYDRSITDSVRRGRKCVSSLAKKFEGKIKEKMAHHDHNKTIDNNQRVFENGEVENLTTPPIEIVFPQLPVEKLKDENSKSDVKVTRLEYTPNKSRRS